MIKDFTPITVFFLFFMEVILLLVAETNKHYNQYDYLDTLDNDGRCLWLSDVTVQEMYNDTNETWCQEQPETLPINCRTILYTILHQHNETWQVSSYTEIPTF